MNINRSCYPCFTPQEMINMGVYNKNTFENFYNAPSNLKNNVWFENYVNNNDPGERWYNKAKMTYERFLLNPCDETRQSLLEIGWNPEVEFNTDNVITGSNMTIKKLQESAIQCEIVDITEDVDDLLDHVEDNLQQAARDAVDYLEVLFKSDEYMWIEKVFGLRNYIDNNGNLVFLSYDVNRIKNDKDYNIKDTIYSLVQMINNKFLADNNMINRVVPIERENMPDTGELRIERRKDVGNTDVYTTANISGNR